MGNEGGEECLGSMKQDTLLESGLSTRIRIPPPRLPPGSSKHPLASSLLLPPQPRTHGSGAARSLGPAEPSCQTLLSTNYRMRKRDRDAQQGWWLKSSFQAPASQKVPAPLLRSYPAVFAWQRVTQGAPAAAPWLLHLLVAPSSAAAATLRAPLATHRTARRPGGDGAGGGERITRVDLGVRKKNFDVGNAHTGLRRNQTSCGAAAGERFHQLWENHSPAKIGARTLPAPWAIPRAPRNLWFSSPQEKQWAWEALLVHARGENTQYTSRGRGWPGIEAQRTDANANPARATGARAAAACKSRVATTFGQSDCYKVCSLLRRDRHI